MPDRSGGLPRGRSLLVDTNVLLLYVVGRFDPELIRKHKRTRQFGVRDYEILDSVLRRFGRIVATPNVLTETSNLLSQIGEETGEKLRILLAGLIEVFEEQYVPSIDASKIQEFRRLGLTDSSILSLAQQDHLVLTDDIHLFLALQERGIQAINFHHLRVAAWG